VIRIIIVDGQEEFRNHLCEQLSNQNDFEVVGVGCDGYEAVKLVDTHKPDIVLMDTNLPMGDGMKTAALIKYRSPQTSIIVSWDGRESRIFSVPFNGISGYIIKQENSNLLCHAIRAIHYGGSFVGSKIILKFGGELRTAQSEKKKWEIKNHSDGSVSELPRTISHSEAQIIYYVGKGYTNKEIAKKLGLTEGTVRNYISSVLQKTGFHNRTQIAIYAVRAGLSFPA